MSILGMRVSKKLTTLVVMTLIGIVNDKFGLNIPTEIVSNILNGGMTYIGAQAVVDAAKAYKGVK